MPITENERIATIIKAGSKTAMSLEQIISLEISEWKTSKCRQAMLKAEDYYRNKTDILSKVRTVIGESGAKEPIGNLADNRLVNGFFRKLVDQKVGYLLSKPMSIQTNKAEYQKLLSSYFGKGNLRMFQSIGKEAVKKGIAWLHVYYNDAGQLCFMRIPSEQIIPLWRDAAHTDLQAVIRTYEVETYEGTRRVTVTKVEWWDTNGVKRYVLQAGGQYGLVPDVEAGDEESHFKVINPGEGEAATETGVNWEHVPFIAFKYNEEEQGLLEFIKSLIDDYDARKSENANNLEDLPNSIYKVKNFEGTKGDEFRKNIATYRVVFVGDDGDVDTINLVIDTEAYKTHMENNRKDIFEFGRGVLFEPDKIGNSPSGVALKFMYADLDMDANIIETEFQASLEQLRWFIDVHITNTTGADYSEESVDFIFNRDIIISESDVITDIKNSVGIISDETLVSNHPYVIDIREELERIKKDKEDTGQDYLGLGGRGTEGGDGEIY
ncbi:phage portal protein, SPP1 family [Desulfitobacterium dehalogenans ATCC 51507]|uniref:Phage portal protein, SPP1 family n=1 Tax=Desulfitobacterium dehalogenans (strain ATCC 51507 / DSM 9161 / JW/IU-DC1) TaxID=756499 RepID=I4A6C5_DESDJ|nr:phage portal protein [Desulfitobacterium dehalogenans]AFL99509.1 phage portal protein, SPP1 family [Desulfitobacterium dehalogenans ATCC 51507]